MRLTVVLGILLLVVGLAGLAWRTFSYTTTEEVVDLGPIEVTTEEEKRIPIPPIVGGIAVVAGVVMIVAGSRKS
jgi:hypothetical protein